MIADLIHRVARDSQPAPQPYRPRPSGWGRCIRASVYHSLKYPQKMLSGRFVVLLEDSSFTEDMTIDWINKTAFKVHSQQMEVVVGKTTNAEIIKGSIDGVIESLTGEEYLFDHKGINHFTFEKIENSFQAGLWDDAVVKYVMQGVAYLIGMAKLSKINHFLLLMKNKNTSAYMEMLGQYDSYTDVFTIKHALSTRIVADVDEGIVGLMPAAENMQMMAVRSNFFGYFNSVEKYILQKTLPPRPYEMTDWHCSYCPWQGTYWEGYEAEFAAMKTA